jgi:MoaA/NifB/PqqE/SkfB family radical SAM enzyme
VQFYFYFKANPATSQNSFKAYKIHSGPWVTVVTSTLGCLCPSDLILLFAAGVDIVAIQLDGVDERPRIA